MVYFAVIANDLSAVHFIQFCLEHVNDIKMLEMAGTGVAMANSVQKVLDIADITAMSNDEDGVAQIIEQYILFY